MKIEQIRGAVADTLEARGLNNRTFLREIRNGKRDDGPYMLGALACMKMLSSVSVAENEAR